MKRKRNSDRVENQQVCDLILTDCNGRSVRVHKALLIDKSDYFARILTENHLHELQLDENYLIELIHYLYRHEADDQRSPQVSNNADYPFEDNYSEDYNSMDMSSDLINGDIEILMHLLALSRKYCFRQLSRSLMTEINYQLRPSNVLTVHKCALELEIEELVDATKLMVLTWLPQLQQTEAFFSLTEDSINNIFAAEAPDIDNECKLNALSAWWSHNKEADMTNLWVKLITCSKK